MLKMSCWVQGSCKLPFGDTAFLTTDLDMDLKLQTSNSGGVRSKGQGARSKGQEGLSFYLAVANCLSGIVLFFT